MTMKPPSSGPAGTCRTSCAPIETRSWALASSVAVRSAPTSPGAARTSRWTRFFACLPSGIRTLGTTPGGTTMTVALYTRLSPKPNGGYEGVDDQITWGTSYAAKAWPGEPVEVFADRGKSAGRDDVRRADFERL